MNEQNIHQIHPTNKKQIVFNYFIGMNYGESYHIYKKKSYEFFCGLNSEVKCTLKNMKFEEINQLKTFS
jgi:hypothetical protein